jgi:hypothetical protein
MEREHPSRGRRRQSWPRDALAFRSESGVEAKHTPASRDSLARALQAPISDDYRIQVDPVVWATLSDAIAFVPRSITDSRDAQVFCVHASGRLLANRASG